MFFYVITHLHYTFPSQAKSTTQAMSIQLAVNRDILLYSTCNNTFEALLFLA